MTRDSLLVSTRSIQGSLDDDNGAMVNVAPFRTLRHPSGVLTFPLVGWVGLIIMFIVLKRDRQPNT